MPGHAGDDGVERTTGRLPGLEGRHLGGHSGAPREVGHPLVNIDSEDLAAGRLELAGDDSGAAPDVEYVGTGAGGHDPGHHGVRVARAGPVVALGVGAKRLGVLADLMRFELALRR